MIDNAAFVLIICVNKAKRVNERLKGVQGIQDIHLIHMGTFPEGQHYLSAAGEIRDIGPLWKGLY